MKLFQLYPKALAHLTCKSPGVAEPTAATPQKERTENRTPLPRSKTGRPSPALFVPLRCAAPAKVQGTAKDTTILKQWIL